MTKRCKMWAWFENKTQKYYHIYHGRHQVEMCSPDGFRKTTERGEGRICEVYVQEVK